VGVSSKGSTLQLESPELLFRAFESGPALFAGMGGLAIGAQPFDISRGGQRFLIASGNAQPTPITVVVNWDAELKKK
jgi:hypothetical protein